MSYGPGLQDRLSACHAGYLSVHPYFNSDTPIEEGQEPTIELISPRLYPAGTKRVSVRLKVSDPEGLDQVLLFVPTIKPHFAAGFYEVKACRQLGGEKDAIVEFNYDGVIPSDGFTSLSDPVGHPIAIEAVDTDGNVSGTSFTLTEISPHHITSLDEHTAQVNSVSLSPDGRTLASGSPDGTIKLWDMATQQSITTLDEHTGVVRSVSFSKDGTLASGSWDGTVKLWNVGTRQSIVTFPHTDRVLSVSFSPNGAILASGTGYGTIELWDVETQTNIGTLPHGAEVLSVSFSPDGAILASGTRYGTIELWDVETQTNIGTLPHGAGVLSVLFSMDGILASGAYDGAVKLWDVATGINFATLWHTSPVLSVSFSPNGAILASGTGDGMVELWDTSEWMQLRLEAEAAVIEVHIPDPNLRAAIEKALGKVPGDTISTLDMENLTRLEASGAGIMDLTGLEAAANLTILYLHRNSIRDISAVADLTKLTELFIWDNNISDISAVSGLTRLTRLGLGSNSIRNISAVSGLTRLTELYLGNNSITNISAVSRLTRLRVLHLWINSIRDISAVSRLTRLTVLHLSRNSISDISAVSGLTNLTELYLWSNFIRDISAVSRLTRLTVLYLSRNSIRDISAVSGLTNLTELYLGRNSIADISAVSGLTNLTGLYLGSNSISDISAVSGLTRLTVLYLWGNNISDVSPLVANTGLRRGDKILVQRNPLSYLSIHTHIPTLQGRGVTVEFDDQAYPALSKVSGDNQEGMPNETLAKLFVVEARDRRGSPLVGVSVTFSVVAGGGTLSVTNTTTDANGRAQSLLTLGPNLETNKVEVSVEGISQTALFRAEATPPPSMPTTLKSVSGDNQSGLTGETLMQPFVVEIHDQYDDPMEGVAVTFTVSIGGGSLSDTSVDSDVNGLARSTLTLGNDPVTNIVEVSVEGVAETVTFHAVAELLEFDFALPSGYSLIHVPLKVRAVDAVPQTITSIGDLYDALGGADAVNILITVDSQTQKWSVYFSPSDRGTPNDRELTDDMGILAEMKTRASVRLSGDPLGANGNSTITLNPGYNIVGVPLKDSSLTHVSDLFTLKGIGGNAPVVTFTDNADFKVVTPVGGPDDIEITGEQAFILDVQRAAMVDISGEGWTNVSGTATAPPMLTGIQVTDTTPVLALRGSMIDKEMNTNGTGFRVTVKNLSTGKAVATATGSDEMGYRLAIVDIETMRAATVGDTLEISAQSPNPFIGVESLRYTVTVEDVKRGWIQLPALVAYEIPAETELLSNYPNPFNPETWIPYQLAEHAFVTLTIYDQTGQVVRTLEVGHRIAAVYETRSKAVYWDGRNEFGEGVASGMYFYHLSAGDYSATRKMVILK